jgi:hypothetical protein
MAFFNRRFRLRSLYPVSSSGYTFGVGAVGTAEKAFVMLNAVSYNSAAAMQAGGGQRLYSALKTIKGIGPILKDNVERFIVDIVTDEAGAHSSPRVWGEISCEVLSAK